MRMHFLTIGVLGSGLFVGGILFGQDRSQPTKRNLPSAAARLAAAERVCQILHEPDGTPNGHQGVEHAYLWSMRRMEAQRDVDAARGDRFSALEAHLQRMRALDTRFAQLHRSGDVSIFEAASTHFYVVEAEELLARERAK